MNRPQVMTITALTVAALGTAGAGAALITSTPALASAHPAPVSWGLSPTRTEVKPGQRGFLIAVQNRGTKPLAMTADVEQASESSSGTWRFAKPDAASGADWIRVTPGHFRLAQGQVRHIAVRITVPRAARGSGQRYLGVVIRPVISFRGLHSTGVVTSAGIASEIILDVPGKVIHATRFEISAPGFSGWGPVPVTASIYNQGTAYDLLNGLQARAGSDAIRFPGLLVIGGSSRSVSATWASAPMFCLPCHITMAGASATVWRLPLLPLAGLVVLVSGFGTGLVVWRRRRRPVDPAPWIADATSAHPRTHRTGRKGGPIGT